MANIKYDYDIEAVHNDWCRENGYPVRKRTSRKPGRPGRVGPKVTSSQADKLTSYKLPGLRPISEGNKGLIHKRKGGRVGPKATS